MRVFVSTCLIWRSRRWTYIEEIDVVLDRNETKITIDRITRMFIEIVVLNTHGNSLQMFGVIAHIKRYRWTPQKVSYEGL